MDSLVNEFQKKIFDSNCSVTELLRMGLIIANKLQSEEIKEWLTDELYGFNNKEVPDYRKIPVSLKFLNPVRGWCPIIIEEESILQLLRNLPIRQSISEIEMHAKSGKEVYIDVPVQMKKMFSKQISFDTDINYVCNTVSLLNIVEIVKNRLVEWILKLEENGVIDINMIFNEEQIEKSKIINKQIINNFYGDKGKIEVKQEIDNV